MRERSFGPSAPGPTSRRHTCNGAPLTELQATVANLQTNAGNRAVTAALSSGAIQRYVMTRKSPVNVNEWVFYSSLQPGLLFKTAKKAADHDTELETARRASGIVFDPSIRSPTLYTYTNDEVKLHAQLPNSRQGPHTVTHIDVTSRLQLEQTADDLRRVFREQVPDTDEIREIVRRTEKPSNKLVVSKLDRYLYDYASLYTSIGSALEESTPALERVKELLASIMDMHPYASYGWKSGKKVSQRAIKAKSEGARRMAEKKAREKETPIGDAMLVDPDMSESSSSSAVHGAPARPTPRKYKAKKPIRLVDEQITDVDDHGDALMTDVADVDDALMTDVADEDASPRAAKRKRDADDDEKNELVDAGGANLFADADAYAAFVKRRTAWIRSAPPTKKFKKSED